MALGGVPSIARISEIVAGQTRYPQWGCKAKPPESPSTQLKPRHDGIQVDDLSVSVEDVVPVQVDVAPRRRRHLFDQRQGFRVSARLVLRESTPLIACESFIQAFLSGFERFVCRLARPSNRWLRRPWSAFCNRFIYRNLRTCDLEITQIYRTFLVDPVPRRFLSQAFLRRVS